MRPKKGETCGTEGGGGKLRRSVGAVVWVHAEAGGGKTAVRRCGDLRNTGLKGTLTGSPNIMGQTKLLFATPALRS